MTRSIIGTLGAATCFAMLGTAGAHGAAPDKSCVDDLYRGFDSRLEVGILAKLPVTPGAVGLEIVRGRPVVAYPHRVVAVDGTTLVGQPFIDLIAGLAVDQSGTVWLHAGQSVRTFGNDVMIDRGKIGTGSRLLNSGTAAFLIAAGNASETRFALRAADGSATPLFRLEGLLRTASVNRHGVAAIVGDDLVMWRPGAPGISHVASDRGLTTARDVTLAGPNRVVVSLSNALVLITEKTRIILGAVSGRVRYDEGTLYVLDDRTGLIWTLKGLEGIGVPEKDAAHAAALLKLDGPASQRRAAFDEAVRIVGCRAVATLQQTARK